MELYDLGVGCGLEAGLTKTFLDGKIWIWIGKFSRETNWIWIGHLDLDLDLFGSGSLNWIWIAKMEYF